RPPREPYVSAGAVAWSPDVPPHPAHHASARSGGPRQSPSQPRLIARRRRLARYDQVLQLARVVRHHTAAVFGDDDSVRVAEAAQLFDVDTRLDREDHSFLAHRAAAAVAA